MGGHLAVNLGRRRVDPLVDEMRGAFPAFDGYALLKRSMGQGSDTQSNLNVASPLLDLCRR